MWRKTLWVFVVVMLATGCAQTRKDAGGGFGSQQDVLTGGPITGTTINDLPPSVKQTLRARAPKAEIADIEIQSRDGRTVYKIAFVEPGRNPTIWVAEDGQTLPKPTAQ